MAAKGGEAKGTKEEKAGEPSMAGMMDMCRRMSAGDMPDCCAQMRQMMTGCCAREDKPAPDHKDA
jgi:hypothetical protein